MDDRTREWWDGMTHSPILCILMNDLCLSLVGKSCYDITEREADRIRKIMLN